jgi:membrane protease YdiL (CAAX protease family)
MEISKIILNREGRPRSGWRVAVFLVAFILIGIVFALLGAGFAAEGAAPSYKIIAVRSFMSLAAALAAGWLCARYLESLPFRSLGFWFTRGWFRDLCLGLGVGLLTIGIAVACAALYGGLSFTLDTAADKSSIAASLAISFVVFAVAAAFEESLFRGYILQTLTRADLGWLAIALTSILFGAAHLANPEASAVSTLNTALAGVWFGIAYLKTRDLWFPFGIHLMWNWAQGSVFGIEVSGMREIGGSPLLHEIDRGPALITGANYGIEAAIPTTIAIVLSIAAIYFSKFPKPNEELLAMTSKENAKPSVS